MVQSDFEKNQKSKYFSKSVIRWYLIHGRRFFWRSETLSLWEWILLESLLRRTKAGTVAKYIKPILQKYREPKDLLEVKSDEIIRDIYPFGFYNQRAKALIQIAHEIKKISHPITYENLVKIPHIGNYIASAVLSFGLGKRVCVVDSNVARVIGRYFNLEIPKDLRKSALLDYSSEIMPTEKWIEYNYSLIDIGATICKKKPKCIKCPVNTRCYYMNEKSMDR